MSDLVKALQENTAAIRALTAVYAGRPGADGGPTTLTPSPSPAANPAGGDGTLKKTDTELDYARDVKSFAVKLATANKPEFMKLLAERGVAKATELSPDQLPMFLMDLKVALGE